MSEIKMSDVFGTSIYDDPTGRLSSAIVLCGPEKDAAIHAISNHDKLTSRVAELEFSLDDRDCYIADADMKNEELVKRAAELEALLARSIDRLNDCIAQDDAKAYKEAEKFIDIVRKALKESE